MIITAKILDARCKSCGCNTVAWWKTAIARKRLCIECDKEIKRQKKAQRPPTKRERARRADLALFEMMGSKNITYEFFTAVTSENSPTVKQRVLRALVRHVLKSSEPFSYVSGENTVETLSAKVQYRKNRISTLPMRFNLKQKGNLMRPHSTNKLKKVKDFYAKLQ